MSNFGRLLRTVRHLQWRQLAGRARFKLLVPRVAPGPAPARRELAGPWVPPARRRASLLGPARLRLLNQDYDLDVLGWSRADVDHLLRYNAHYFDDLTAVDSASRQAWQRQLLERWIRENPMPRGTGWEPYPVSLRIVNLVKWFAAGIAPEPAWLESLANQARWLRQRLEYHLLGNHLFVNAKALVFAGTFFTGDEADEWRRCGLDILARELPEQVLRDGGQFEGSPMYHALALEDLLDLVNLARTGGNEDLRRVAPDWEKTAASMLHWLRVMTHPDGGVGLFNDSADGIAPTTDELAGYAARLGIEAPTLSEGVTALRDSGYIRVARDDLVALLDIAPIGPDYLPGHAHADTLSFELSVAGRRVIVNGGTSRYGVGAERLLERGTAAHSTVEVDGRNSSEVWGGFRVGRRARVREREIQGWTVVGAHDGYGWLPGAPLHRRRWDFAPNELRIDDEVGNPALPAVARYIFGHGIELTALSANTWTASADGRALGTFEVLEGRASLTPANHAREFGQVGRVQCLAVQLDSGRASVRFRR